jgi:hypothetical protein
MMAQGGSRPQGRSSSLRCGRSTLTPLGSTHSADDSGRLDVACIAGEEALPQTPPLPTGYEEGSHARDSRQSARTADCASELRKR